MDWTKDVQHLKREPVPPLWLFQETHAPGQRHTYRPPFVTQVLASWRGQSSEKFDILSLSLVLNYPTLARRNATKPLSGPQIYITLTFIPCIFSIPRWSPPHKHYDIPRIFPIQTEVDKPCLVPALGLPQTIRSWANLCHKIQDRRGRGGGNNTFAIVLEVKRRREKTHGYELCNNE